MSAPTKLRGGSVSELTRLKARWRELPDDARSYWQELFVSSATQAAIRSTLLSKLKINLRFDKQLTEFRSWLDRQLALDVEAEAMRDDEQRLREEFGSGWTLDQIREEVLRRSYVRSISSGNFDQGLATSREHRGWFTASTDREKFELEAAEKMLSQALRAKADEINASSLTQADKIAAMRKAAFQDVKELQESGRLKIPKA